jgi:hypothetical protein
MTAPSVQIMMDIVNIAVHEINNGGKVTFFFFILILFINRHNNPFISLFRLLFIVTLVSVEPDSPSPVY